MNLRIFNNILTLVTENLSWIFQQVPRELNQRGYSSPSFCQNGETIYYPFLFSDTGESKNCSSNRRSEKVTDEATYNIFKC